MKWVIFPLLLLSACALASFDPMVEAQLMYAKVNADEAASLNCPNNYIHQRVTLPLLRAAAVIDDGSQMQTAIKMMIEASRDAEKAKGGAFCKEQLSNVAQGISLLIKGYKTVRHDAR